MKIDRYCHAAAKCRSIMSMILFSRNIRHTWIFAGVPRDGGDRGVKGQWGCRRRHFFTNFGHTNSIASYHMALRCRLVIDCKMNDLEMLE